MAGPPQPNSSAPKKRPTAQEFMQRFVPGQTGANAAQGHSNPMSPGQFGHDSPTQHDGATNGRAGTKAKKNEVQGQKSANHRGTGKKTNKGSPSNHKHAGSMKKGPGVPTIESIGRRLSNSGTPLQGKESTPRSGVLSAFEGFRNKS